MVVGALADEHLQRSVLAVQLVQPVAELLFGKGVREGVGFPVQVLGRNVAVKVFQALKPDLFQHFLDIGLCMRKIRDHCLLSDLGFVGSGVQKAVQFRGV